MDVSTFKTNGLGSNVFQFQAGPEQGLGTHVELGSPSHFSSVSLVGLGPATKALLTLETDLPVPSRRLSLSMFLERVSLVWLRG